MNFIKSNPAIVISILALLFTLFSFWWMNWRKGRLIVGVPRSYAAVSTEGLTFLEFPFIFFNSGPIPLFIQNLKIIIANEDQRRPFNFTATVDKLGKDEGRSFATQFPVRGREALSLICEFQRRPGGITFQEGVYPLELYAIVDNKKKWKCICRFNLNVQSRSAELITQLLTVHDNTLD